MHTSLPISISDPNDCIVSASIREFGISFVRTLVHQVKPFT